jgi:predicted amidohydrolase
MANKATVGIVQMCATSDVEANVDSTLGLVGEAAKAGAEAVFVPEAFAFIGAERERRPHLEPLPAGGPILRRASACARDAGIHLVLGGFPEAASDGRAFNTCVHLGADGEVAALYRKIHLFDVDLADGTRILESRSTAPGDQAVVTDLPFGPLGLTVCYDVRFPQLYQALADKGALAITVPSAFFKNTGRSHWHVLLRARAIEAQCYIIAPAQHGDHQHRGRQSYGHALVVDPWGDVVVECEDGDGFALTEIDPARTLAVRAELPSLTNRRAFY